MNRNKLIDLFISNLSNVIVHRILEKAIDRTEITEKYHKEAKGSLEIAKRYREKINPSDRILPLGDIDEIRARLTNRVRAELNARIKRGYTNINLSLVEGFVEDALRELGVVSRNR